MSYTSLASRIRGLPRWPHAFTIAGLLLASLLVGLVTIWTGEIGQLSWWWPAAGLGAAAALSASDRSRPWVCVTYGLVIALASIIGDRGIWVVVLAGVSAAMEVAVVSWVTFAGRGPGGVSTLAGTARFLIGALAAAAIAGLALGAAVALAGGDFFATAAAITASHASALILIAPLVLIPRERSRSGRLRTALLTIATVVAVGIAFAPWVDDPLGFLPVPVLMYAAFTQSMRATYVQLLLAVTLVAVLTPLGGGAFANAVGAIGVVGLLQVYSITLAVTVLLVGAAQRERRTLIDQRERVGRMVDEAFSRARSGYAIFVGGDKGELSLLEGNVTAFATFEDELESNSRGETRARRNGALAQLLSSVAARETVTVPWPPGPAEVAPFQVSVEATTQFDFRIAYLVFVEDLRTLRATEASMVARLEKEKELVRALRETNQQRDDFVASVTHELRTPLTSISGYAEELEEMIDTPREKEYVAVILRNTERLLGVVNNVLATSKRQREPEAPAPTTVDLALVLRQCLDDLRFTLTTRRQTMEVDLERSLFVLAHEPNLARVFTNVLTNAAKFSRPGAIITVSAVRQEGEIVVWVRDQGPGLPEHELEQVFELFYRSSSSIRDGIAGTGLGLAITRDLLADVGGSILLRNSPDGEAGLIAEIRLRSGVRSEIIA